MVSWVEGVRVMISLAGTEVLVTNCKHHLSSPTVHNVCEDKGLIVRAEVVEEAGEDKVENVL